MSLEQIFSVSNLVAIIGWILLIVAPRWRWTERLVISGLWSVLLSLVYLVLIVFYFRGAEGDFGSLDAVAKLFESRPMLLAGWVHYLAFDLLVGALEVQQARVAGIPHLIVVPALVLTFMLGPIGFLLFVIIRSIRTRRLAGVGP